MSILLALSLGKLYMYIVHLFQGTVFKSKKCQEKVQTDYMKEVCVSHVNFSPADVKY